MRCGLHRLYSITERSKRRFANRFTPLGKLVLLMTVISLVFGINTERTLIYQIFGVSCSFLLFSWLISLRFCKPLEVIRHIPDSCMAGVPLRYTVEIVNTGKKTVKGLLFVEDTEPELPGCMEFLNAMEEGEELRNVFDRKMRYYRWLWLVNRSWTLRCYESAVGEIAAGRKRKFEVTLLPQVRGNVVVKGYKIRKLDPFGLCRMEMVQRDGRKVTVYPKIYPMRSLHLPEKRKYHQGGLAMAQERGDSMEFFSLREYQHGDPLKHIDWKGTARTGEVTIKQYRDEYFSRYALVVDTCSVLQYSERFEGAISVAASLVMAQKNNDVAIDQLFLGDIRYHGIEAEGDRGKELVLEILTSATPSASLKFADIQLVLQQHMHQLVGFVIVLIGWDEERKQLLHFLLAHKKVLTVILIVKDQHQCETLRQDGIPGLNIHCVVAGDIEEGLQQL